MSRTQAIKPAVNPYARGGLRAAWRKLSRNKLATFCFILLVLEVLVLALAPVLTAFGPEDTDVASRLAPGFWAKWGKNPVDAMKYKPIHPLGTDHLGRDMLSRLLYGGRTSLLVGLTSTCMGLFWGVLFGMLAGYYKRLDNIIMRVMDLLFTFPGILLAMLIVAMLGSSTFNATMAISIWSVPSFARMVRSRVLQVREEDYIMAIRSLGSSDARILTRHVFHNTLPIFIVIATMRMGSSLISISTLSYLGMGVPAPAPEWGGLIATGKNYLWQRPSLIVLPGLMVMLTVICLNILGDKLRDILDPALKS